MRACCRPLLLRKTLLSASVSPSSPAAAVPSNYSNIPYQKKRVDVDEDDEDVVGGVHQRKKDSTQFTSSKMSLAGGLCAVLPPPPPPLRSTFINPSRTVTSFNSNYRIRSFRHTVCSTSDVSMRPLQFLQFAADADADTHGAASKATTTKPPVPREANSFGDRLRDQLSFRWAAKFYGQVTFGPRNYPYPSSRWLARRFQMKKHKIVKRFRFRRYKLAAVANLPFAKMIRVGMLPELKSSKTKKGDAVDAGLSAQLVSAAKSSSSGGKTKGRRSRPKSKYQV